MPADFSPLATSTTPQSQIHRVQVVAIWAYQSGATARKRTGALGSEVSPSTKLEDTGEGHDFFSVPNLGPTRPGEPPFEGIEVII